MGTLPSLSDLQTSVLASSPLGSLPGASNCPSPSLVPPPSPTAHNIPTPAVCPAQLFHHIPLHGLTEAQALGCGEAITVSPCELPGHVQPGIPSQAS